MRYFLYSLIIFLSFNSFSQSESELAAKTLKVYKDKNYEAAKSDYLKLLSLQPRSADYNFYYGVCLLKTTASKAEAIKHLEYAIKANVTDPEAYYYLGLAYHLNYQFKMAIANYQLFLKNNGVSKKNSEFDAERQIEMCQNGLKLFQKFSDIIVVDKKEYDASEFFRLYNEKSLNGSILISKLDQSKVDKKYDHFPVIFYPNNSSIIFFSSYGDKYKGDKDIYFKTKTTAGWGPSQLLKGDVNTDFDEDFPFFDSQNNMLYFSSKGHNSMGGYDVFSAKYNPSTKTFNDVKNVDFAISSTGDDLFYVPNENEGTAWFASNRESKPDKLTIYKVEIERYPSTLALINGAFESVDKSKGNQIKIELFIKKENRRIGSFNTDDKGQYNIPVYFSGDYEYRVTIPGSNNVFPLNFNIPKVSNLTQYRQKIIYKKIDEKEYLELLVLSEEELSKDDDKLLDIIRRKSELKVEEKPLITEIRSLKDYNLLDDQLQLGKESLEEQLNFEAKANQKIHDNVRVINVLQDELKTLVASQELNTLSATQIEDAKQKIERINTLEKENSQLKILSDSLAIENTSVSKKLATLNELSAKLDGLPDSLKSDLTPFKKKNNVGMDVLTSISTDNKPTLFDDYDAKKEKLKEHLNEVKELKNKLKESEAELNALNNSLLTAKTKAQPIIEEDIKTQKQKIAQQKRDIEYLEDKIEKESAELTILKDRKDFITSIYQKKVDKVYSNQDVSNELNKLETKNFRPVKNLLEQSYTQLKRKEEGELLIGTDIQSEDLEIAWQEYKALENTSEETVSSTRIEKYQKVETELKNEIENVKSQPSTIDSEKYIKKLENALEEVTGRHEELMLAEDNKQIAAKNNVIDQLYPDYNQVIEKINETEYGNDWDKVIALKQQEKILLEKISSKEGDGVNEQSPELKKDISTSVAQLQKHLQYISDKESENLKGTAASLQKAIKNLNFNDNEEAFVGQIQDLKEVIEKDIVAATELRDKLSEEDVDVRSIDEAISKLEEALVLAEAKEDEYEQLKAVSSNNEIAQSNTNQENTTTQNTTLNNQEVKTTTNNNNESTTSNEANNVTQNREESVTPVNTNQENTTTQNTTVNNQEVKTTTNNNNESTTSNDANNVTQNREESVTPVNTNQENTTTQNTTVNNQEVKTTTNNNNESTISNDANNITQNREESVTPVNTNQENTTTQNSTLNNQEVKTTTNNNNESTTSNEANNVAQNREESVTPINTNQENTTTQNTALNNQGVKTTTNNNNQPTISNDITQYPVSNQEVTQNTKESAALLEKIDNFEKVVLKENFDDISYFEHNDFEETETLENLETKIETVDIFDRNTKVFIENTASQLKPLTESTNSLVKDIANNQVQFLHREIKNQSLLNSQNSLDEETSELPLKYHENRLTTLYTEQQRTQSAKEILTKTKDKLSKKEQEAQKELLNLLDAKEDYLKKEIASTQSTIELHKQSDETLTELQEEFIELEKIIIKLPKANAEQITLYKLLDKELENLEKLYVQKDKLENQLAKALNETDETEISEISHLIRQNKQLRTELEQLITSNMVLLKAEIKDPTVTMVAVASSQQLEKEVAEVAFTVHPEETISTDQIKSILDADNYPKGLFFRVQVGAFAKPINENVYRDFSPISMENLNKGLIKYMAGYFTVEDKAGTARDQIRQLGFKDAFVVAYCDGKRIPVYEARRLLAAGICLPVTTRDLLFHIDSSKQQLLAKVERQNAVAPNNTVSVSPHQEQQPIMINNTMDATSLKELYFTVQIGVFNRYVEDAMLKGLNPINTDALSPTTIRYSVGVFDDLNKAKDQRTEAVQKGFTDAFVVAYYQGKRITVQAANALLAAGTAELVKVNNPAPDLIAAESVQQEVNYIDQLKTAVEERKEIHPFSSVDVNNTISTSISRSIQFNVSSSKLNLVFYWWIMHNFDRYTLQKVDNTIVVHGYCDEEDKIDIVDDFQALQFLNINIVK